MSVAQLTNQKIQLAVKSSYYCGGDDDDDYDDTETAVRELNQTNESSDTKEEGTKHTEARLGEF